MNRTRPLASPSWSQCEFNARVIRVRAGIEHSRKHETTLCEWRGITWSILHSGQNCSDDDFVMCQLRIVGIPGEPFPPSLAWFRRELRLPLVALPPFQPPENLLLVSPLFQTFAA